MQLTSFFLEHLVLYGLAAISAKGPSGAQLPTPGRGLHLGAKVGRALFLLEVPHGPRPDKVWCP